MPAKSNTDARSQHKLVPLPNLYSKFITIVPPVSPRWRLARLYARAMGDPLPERHGRDGTVDLVLRPDGDGPWR